MLLLLFHQWFNIDVWHVGRTSAMWSYSSKGILRISAASRRFSAIAHSICRSFSCRASDRRAYTHQLQCTVTYTPTAMYCDIHTNCNVLCNIHKSTAMYCDVLHINCNVLWHTHQLQCIVTYTPTAMNCNMHTPTAMYCDIQTNCNVLWHTHTNCNVL